MKAKFFMDMSDLVDNDNNSKARAAAIIPGPGDSLIDLCQMGRDIELSPDESRVCSVLSGKVAYRLLLDNHVCLCVNYCGGPSGQSSRLAVGRSWVQIHSRVIQKALKLARVQ